MEKFLKYFGITPHEVAVYHTLLKIGGAKTSQIALDTGLKRTSVNEYIRSLEAKGFVNATKVGNKYFYRAEDPDQFYQILHERQFVVDHLVPKLKQLSLQEDWQVHSLRLEEAQRKIKRAKRKQNETIIFGKKETGGALLNNQSVVLFSTDKDISAIEIKSKAIVEFHKTILKITATEPIDEAARA